MVELAEVVWVGGDPSDTRCTLCEPPPPRERGSSSQHTCVVVGATIRPPRPLFQAERGSRRRRRRLRFQTGKANRVEPDQDGLPPKMPSFGA